MHSFGGKDDAACVARPDVEIGIVHDPSSPVSLKKNVVANFLGQGWRALMGLVFIPLYIKYLGIEAYGLIGIFALLQAWLALLDMGMRPALGREMARFTSGAHNAQSIRDLLRTIEVIGTERDFRRGGSDTGPGGEVEWFIVPVQTGTNLAIECALEGHKEAGMVGTVTIN